MSRLRRRGLGDPQHDEWLREVGYRQLGEILYWRWDPIGISPTTFPWNEGEYNTYALELIPLLRDGISPADVVAFLERAQRSIGGPEPVVLAELGEEIHRWYGDSIHVWLEFGPRDPYRVDLP